MYRYTGELEKAEKSGKEALKYAELLQNEFMVTRSLLSLGKLKNQEGNFESSIAYLQSSIRTAGNDFGDMYYLSLIYKELSKAFEGGDNLKQSFEAYKKYHELNQLVFYIKAERNYSNIVTSTQNYMIVSPLHSFCEKMVCKDFLHVHRSYVVNIKKLDAVAEAHLEIERKIIPVSKMYKGNLMAALRKI